MPRADVESRIANATFRLLAKEPWSRVTLASVARAAKVSWDEMLRTAPTRAALVGLVLHRAGADTAKRHKPDRMQNPRERVFDVIMCWFEGQNSRKDVIRSLYDGLRREPFTLLALRGEFLAAAEWLLALAEADAGTASTVCAVYIGGVVARVLPVWFSDDEDLGKTMAELDRDLRRVERFLWSAEKSKPNTRRKPQSS